MPAPDGPKIADKWPASNLPLTDFKIHFPDSVTNKQTIGSVTGYKYTRTYDTTRVCLYVKYSLGQHKIT